MEKCNVYVKFLLTNSFSLHPHSPINCLVWRAVGISQVTNELCSQCLF